MDFIISFFRDFLDGPLYIAVLIINSILICSCIGYLGEQYLNNKKARKEFEETHASVAVDNGTGVGSQTPAPTATTTVPVTQTPVSQVAARPASVPPVQGQ